MSKLPQIHRATDPEFSHRPWFEVYIDTVLVGEREHRYGRIVESEGRPGVVIIPVSGSSIGLVRLLRFPLGETQWELPRGYGETNDPLADARRELFEETGISVGSWRELGYIHTNSGLLATEVRIFHCAVAEDVDTVQHSDSEIDEFRWWPVAELREAIRDNRISDGVTISALYRAELAGLVECR